MTSQYKFEDYNYSKEAEILGLSTSAIRVIIESINLIGKLAYENAKDKGFYEDPITFGDRIALIHSEASEALESYREKDLPNQFTIDEKGKPVSVMSEIADVVIRCGDMCSHYEGNLGHAIIVKMAYNRSRPYKHGGKTL